MRPITIVGAPSSIGIRPYDDGGSRRLDLSPRVLRELGLGRGARARDAGDVIPPPYRDFVRPNGRPRNEEDVASYSCLLGEAVGAAARDRSFVVVLGGDCSIVLGCLLGARPADRSRIGLAYIDAHADFATPAESRTGSAASMCLGLAVGRGDTPLARLGGDEPLVQGSDVVLIGRRDAVEESWYGEHALSAAGVLDLTDSSVREHGIAPTAHAALERLTHPGTGGFWIHLDADVLDPKEMPAVDSPEPGGLSFNEIGQLLTPLVRHPAALGLELTIYDPALDPDRAAGRRLVDMLEDVLTNVT